MIREIEEGVFYYDKAFGWSGYTYSRNKKREMYIDEKYPIDTAIELKKVTESMLMEIVSKGDSYYGTKYYKYDNCIFLTIEYVNYIIDRGLHNGICSILQIEHMYAVDEETEKKMLYYLSSQ